MLRTQNVSEQNQKHFLCSGHKICVRNKCCPCRQTGKHLCRQQCVRNNVSSFARALRHIRGGGLGEPNNASCQEDIYDRKGNLLLNCHRRYGALSMNFWSSNSLKYFKILPASCQVKYDILLPLFKLQPG